MEDAGQQGNKLACGSKQLCPGLEAGIKGAIHVVWQQRQAKLDVVGLGVGTEDGSEVEDGEVVGSSCSLLVGERVEDQAVIDEAMATAAQTKQNPFGVMMNQMSKQVVTGEGLTLR